MAQAERIRPPSIWMMMRCPASGCGLCIDRLVMIMIGAKTLRDVIIYPTMRELGE